MRPRWPAVALLERAHGALGGLPFFHRALADPMLFTALGNAAALLWYGLV